MIVDLSYSPGSSVNDGIDSSLSSIRYASVDNAVEIIRSLGQGTLLTKFDLKDAYKFIPVHPSGHHRLGIMWDGATDASHLAYDQRQRYFLPSLMLWHGSLDVLGL